MKNSLEEIKILLQARAQCIWITSYEENVVINDIKKLVKDEIPGMNIRLWSQTEGLKSLPLVPVEKVDPPDIKMCNPKMLFTHIRESQEASTNPITQTMFILRDLHLMIEAPDVRRAIRDAKEYPYNSYCPIVVISPIVNIPQEHEKLFTVVEYDLPSKEEITVIVDNLCRGLQGSINRGKDYTLPTDTEKKALIKSFVGLTKNEIMNTSSRSIREFNKFSLEAIMKEKINLVKKSGVLDYVIPRFNLDDIGGNRAFKEWIEEVEETYDENATSFGCKKPKGYVAVGVPGCSKTLGAEAIAKRWNVPLIKLNMSKIMSRFVGSSEQRIEQAFKVVKACAPCVFLMDEVEKALSGTKSSNASDSGTTSRVFAKVLEFLNDNSEVFVVMTSNDITQLPPELTRTGRVDAIWYFSLPTLIEREEIFSIHLDRTRKKLSKGLAKKSAEMSENFTGAEIEEVVNIAVRKAYKRFKSDGKNLLELSDIEQAISEVIPLYISSREKILMLESWAEGRARRTNKKEDIVAEKSVDNDLLEDILSGDY